MAKEIEIDIKVEADVKSVNDLTADIKKMSIERDKATNPKKIREFNDELKKLEEQTKDNKKATEEEASAMDSLNNATGGAIDKVKGLGKQFIKLLTNPVGAVIAAIAIAVVTLFKAFSRTEEGGNKLNKGMAVLSGVFTSLLNNIEPIASFIVDKLVKGFDLLGDAVASATSIVSKGLKSLGFDDAAKGLDKLTSSTGGLIKKTTELADIEAKLLKGRREQSIIEKKALIDAENLRQKRDDESNSLAKRIEFNKELSKVLKKQTEDELRIANQALRAAELKLEIDGKTTVALDGLAEAQLEILDIQERINGQQSEQLANENSLRNEGIALAKEKEAERKTEADANQKEIDEAAAIAQSEKEAAQLKEDDKIKLLSDSNERALEIKRAHKLKLAEEGLNDDNLTPDQIRARFEATLEAKNEIFEAEQQAVNEKFELELIGKQERDALLAESQFNQDKATTENKKKQAEAQVQIEKNKSQAIAGTIQATGNVLQAFGDLAGQETAKGKALSIAAATINTFTGVSDALAAKTFTVFDTALKFANAAAIGVAGIANVKKIVSVKVPNVSSGGSAPINFTAPSGGRTSASAPTLNNDTLFSTQNLNGNTENNENEGGVNVPIKAYVVESEISQTQEDINRFELASEIG